MNEQTAAIGKSRNLRNRTFGLLTALYPTGEVRNNSLVWHCRCACGNEVDITARNLNRGTKSCGCLRSRPPRAAHSIENNLHFVDGTCIENLISSQNRPVASSTGVRGVYYQKRRGGYEATIGFKGKKHYLGSYETIEEAARVRRRAEELIYGNFLNAYFESLASPGADQTESIRKQYLKHGNVA